MLDPIVSMKFAKIWGILWGKGNGKNHKNCKISLSLQETHVNAQTCMYTFAWDTKSTHYDKQLSLSELQYQSRHCAELIKETYSG